MHPGFHEEDAIGKVYDRELIARLWPFLRPHWRWLLASFLLVPLYWLLELLPAMFIGRALNEVTGNGGVTPGAAWLAAVADPPGSVPLLPWLGGMFLLSAIVAAFTQFGRMIVMALMGQRAMLELRRTLFDHVQRVPLRFFDRYPVGRLVTRLSHDIESLGEMFSAGIVMLVADLLRMTGFAVLLFALNWRLALVSMAVVPLIAFAAVIMRYRVRGAFRKVRVRIARINANLQETITGMRVVQLFARERRNLVDFRVLNKSHRDAWFESIHYDALLSAMLEVAGPVMMAFILWYGAGMVQAEVVEIGTLLIFADYTRRFMMPVQDLSQKYSVMQSSMASLERIFEVLDVPVEVEHGQPSRREIRGEVVFENVTFGYGETPVLRDVSFRVRPGERVALVGHTGAGKTTVLRLLLRFHDPDSGRILIDGVDIREISRAELRRHLAYVMQDVFLFTGDLEYNVSLGHPEIDRGRIETAARTVHLEGLLSRLPGGWGQQVRERGANFSGGERQLLSFARALAHRPQILLLDEATASIDTDTEALVQDALEQLLEGKTSLVVAHRLSTIQDADRIYVLHHGELREQGRHDELLELRGLYWKLYQLQYASQDVAS